jgi:hypothetical protein
MSWPNGVDPWYLANTTDNNARRVYYNITGTPTQVCDGTAASWPTIQSTIQSRMAVASPIWMDLIAQVNGTTLNLTAKCVANTAIQSNHVIQLVLMERYKFLVSPNGMNDHYHPMVKMAPTASGQAFTAPVPGDTVTYAATFTIQPNWSVNNLDIAAFVQNNVSKEILQARCEQVPLNFPNLMYTSNAITDPNSNGRAEPGESCTMAITLSNALYYQTATNIVATLSTTDPSITVTANTSNYPNIPSGGQGVNQTPFAFNVNASATPHTATFHLHVVANPLQTVYDTDFEVFIDFQSVLLVDDDGGSNYQTWYLMDLDSIGATHEYWNVDSQGEVPLSWINHFDNAIWFTSNLTAPLSATEQTVISGYLSQGGHLFLSGEELDEQFRGTPFYTNTLHCSSLQAVGYFQLTGLYGDPISNGTLLMLVGGTGAGNSYSPNAIAPGTDAFTVYTYDNSGSAGCVRWSSGNQKLVYTAFNFEATSGLASTTPRRTVLNNILNWFAGIAPPAQFDVTLTPVNPPIVVPAQGGSFQFNAAVVNHGPNQMPFWGWARMKYPNGTYSGNTLGPVQINPPVGVTVSRLRNQNIPASHPAGVTTYLGYTGLVVAYPAMDSSSFTFTKSATADGGPVVWDAVCSGEPFPGEVIASTPTSFGLVAAYPNPFNPSTTISYQLANDTQVSLRVFDTAGRLVVSLADGWRQAGSHQVTFDGSNLASGLYLYVLSAEGQVSTGKLALMK